MYAAETDRQARLALEKVRFQPGRIPASEARDGFLFFRVVPSARQEWTASETLYIKNLRLNDGRISSLQVQLTHANP